ncbi:MAG TPA: response regulator transcription factor, partial [Candidatus Limnocylindria bacterium]
LPQFEELSQKELEQFDVVLVGCDERSLLSRSFRRSVAKMAMYRPVIAVIADLTAVPALEAAQLGFHGALDRGVEPRALERAVHAVMRGELAYSRSDLSALAKLAFATADTHPANEVRFTPRERQVIALIAQGSTDEHIGRALGISTSTAHKHVQSAMRRANVRSRSQLIGTYGMFARTRERAPAV